MSEYVALDVETANADMSSICQIGVVCYSNGIITNKWDTLVNPEDFFDEINIFIHGITQEMVENAPTFPQIIETIREFLSSKIVATHTHFDRVSISRAIDIYDLSPIECTWLDTARVSRRTWLQFSKTGYGLSNLAEFLHIEFKHHDALEDARVAGEILHKAIEITGLSIEEWLTRVELPIDPLYSYKDVARKGNPDGRLVGETIVFTGRLSKSRNICADLSAQAGCDVGVGVTKETTLLVVGDQDIQKLAGHDKSNKHRKAEDLILKGQNIRILGESDFIRMIE